MLLQVHSRATDQVVDAERVGQCRRIPIIDRKHGNLLERRVKALKGKPHCPVEAWIERPLDSARLLRAFPEGDFDVWIGRATPVPGLEASRVSHVQQDLTRATSIGIEAVHDHHLHNLRCFSRLFGAGGRLGTAHPVHERIWATFADRGGRNGDRGSGWNGFSSIGRPKELQRRDA